jgi:hypothetical protein
MIRIYQKIKKKIVILVVKLQMKTILNMKSCTIVFMFIVNSCVAQQWQAEIMGGLSGYNGDLTHSSFKGMGPAIAANIKYLLPNDFLLLRAGISFGTISGSDKNSSDPSIQPRNLNFKSDVFEGNLCLEVNLLDPTEYIGYPYIFAGVGIFHFNPYTYDNNNQKTYLQPLGTEGQGLAAYPNRAVYSLTQFCVPFGVGWKQKINEKFDLIYELGFRYTNTDYLDDVSTTYANPQILLQSRGPIAEQLAWRYVKPAIAVTGMIRGNPQARDWYYMTGLKFCYKFGGQ